MRAFLLVVCPVWLSLAIAFQSEVQPSTGNSTSAYVLAADIMATRTRNICGTCASVDLDNHYRYTVPVLEAVAEGKGNGKKTRLDNIDEVADALEVLPQHLVQFISADLATSAVNTSEIRGHWSGALLEAAVQKFEDVYLICHGASANCRKPELNVRSSDDGILKAKCRACGWRGELDEKFQHERVTKSITQHLNKTKTKWCGNLRGDPAWNNSEVSVPAQEGAEGGTLKVKKKTREKKESKEKTEKTTQEDKDIESPDNIVVEPGEHGGFIHALSALEGPPPEKLTIEELQERQEREVADLAAEMHAKVEALKGSAGNGKKAKERLDAVEREAEQRNYSLWSQHQEELEHQPW